MHTTAYKIFVIFALAGIPFQFSCLFPSRIICHLLCMPSNCCRDQSLTKAKSRSWPSSFINICIIISKRHLQAIIIFLHPSSLFSVITSSFYFSLSLDFTSMLSWAYNPLDFYFTFSCLHFFSFSYPCFLS